MHYIVMDLEWNQPVSYASAAYRKVGSKLLFEVIQIGELTTIGDYFVVASAGNTTLVKSLCEDLDEYLGRQGIEPKRIEGRSSAQWILMDYRDVIVHIFYAETRNFYSIDRVWADAPRLPLELEGEKK